jgi:ATP-dependent helicase HrpA
MLATPQQLRYLKKELFRDSRDRLVLSVLGSFENLHEQLIRLAYYQTFRCEDIPRTKIDYEQRLSSRLSELVGTANRIETNFLSIAKEFANIQKALRTANGLTQLPLQKAIREQLAALIGDDFPAGITPQWLAEYPRYLKAISLRLERFAANPAKDAEMERELQGWWNKYLARKAEFARRQSSMAGIQEFRWLLEEYRVSLFAQQLGTKVPVSGKRLEKFWQTL